MWFKSHQIITRVQPSRELALYTKFQVASLQLWRVSLSSSWLEHAGGGYWVEFSHQEAVGQDRKASYNRPRQAPKFEREKRGQKRTFRTKDSSTIGDNLLQQVPNLDKVLIYPPSQLCDNLKGGGVRWYILWWFSRWIWEDKAGSHGGLVKFHDKSCRNLGSGDLSGLHMESPLLDSGSRPKTRGFSFQCCVPFLDPLWREVQDYRHPLAP